MTKSFVWRAVVAGWAGGFVGNALLGSLFSSSWIKNILYDPNLQSEVFLWLTPQRDVVVSVVGLIVLSGIHGLLFARLAPSLPGRGWKAKGLWWGFVIWAMYWVFQEWFIYVTLLREPIWLAALELVILLSGALIEGLVIARIIGGGPPTVVSTARDDRHEGDAVAVVQRRVAFAGQHHAAIDRDVP